MQYKNKNTVFQRSSAVPVTIALKSNVTAVLTC